MIHNIPEPIKLLLSGTDRFVLAIDGRCGAGKTTLAGQIAQTYNAFVVHLDDFFLPKGMQKSGHGNLEKERLLREVILPLSQGKEVCYRVFSCCEQRYTQTVTIPRGASVVVEGSYAMLDEFRFAYTHSVFLNVDGKEQRRRILKRNGEAAWRVFETRWIPEEEQYIEAQHPETVCDVCGCFP